MEILRSQNNVNFGKKPPSPTKTNLKFIKAPNNFDNMNTPKTIEWMMNQTKPHDNTKIERDLFVLRGRCSEILLNNKKPMDVILAFTAKANEIIGRAHGIKQK